ncbi:MAG: imidazole glycerol phosphate synthase subunit HisH [Clostridiaceae bacterium]|nr:imidazole glycerol phosphate synthase subunit HisH [Clostridiaceae bacterium]
MIAIVDYGMGNLGSVRKALSYIGYESVISREPDQLMHASGVVLPGVGAFDPAMAALESLGLDRTVKDFVSSGRPFLGVCLGMQLLFDGSDEGVNNGLGLIPGRVKRLPKPQGQKIPHMGWNDLISAADPVFRKGDYVYFVHSYYCDPTDQAHVAAEALFGIPFACAVSKDNILAAQFHPEKSGEVGLSILNRWARRTR